MVGTARTGSVSACPVRSSAVGDPHSVPVAGDSQRPPVAGHLAVRHRSFSASLTTVSLTFAAMTGSLLFLAFYMQLVRGYSPLQAGAFTLPVAVGQLLAAPRSAKMVERFGARKVIGFGLVLAGSVFASFVFLQPDTPAWILLVTWFFLGFGLET